MSNSLADTCGIARMIIVAALATCLSGCVHVLQAYNTPGEERVHVVTTRSGQYAIRVEDHPETLVPPDGRVRIDVPALPRGCSVYFLGFIKVSDGSPERIRAIQLLRDGKVVRKLSLQTIHDLPLDSDDYRVVKL